MATPIRLDAPAANDNGSAISEDSSAARVSVSGDRAEHAYACSGNLILPLRFARRLPGWTPTLDSATKG